MTKALAIFLPIGFVAALSARNPVPAPSIPPVETEAGTQGRTLGALQSMPGQSLAVNIQLFSSGTPTSQLSLSIHPNAPLTAPDILAYWHPTTNTALDALPQDAFLLGGLNGVQTRRLTLPAQALERDGTLILYSLAQQRVLNAGPLASHSLLTAGSAP